MKAVNYILLTLTVIAFKVANIYATNDTLQFLLKPTSTLVSHINSTKATFLIDQGYYHENLNIVIDKSCSGFNFLILCYLVLAISMIKHFKTNYMKWIIPLALVISYMLTLVSNTSRISISILIERKLNLHFEGLHQIQGVFVYFSFLLALHLLLNHVLKITLLKKDEKLTAY